MWELKKYILKPLVLIGALNWGLIGLFNYDVIGAIFGYGSGLTRIVDILIGIAAVACIALMFMPHETHRR